VHGRQVFIFRITINFKTNRMLVAFRCPAAASMACKGLVIHVSHPGKGECADPVNEDAMLEGVGGKPPGRGRKRQLASDTGDGKT
jgi:hypothetical protein